MKKQIIALIIFFFIVEFLGLNWTLAEHDTSPDNRSKQSDTKLSKLSIEQLMHIKVKLVSKSDQQLSKSPSAVYVITNEDIRRSGLTSIPEVLRMVPGLQVARMNSNMWAITSRGFNKRFANKLLVMVDGRTVYTSLFSGVYWDVQDLLLEDVEHIEVIRGPGGSVWGANAVNGIINIITKKAEDTQGILVTAGAGNEDKGIAGVRFGGKIGENTHYRLNTKYFNRDDFVTPSEDRADDEWDFLRGGFRIDWQRSDENLLTLQGDLYNGDSGQTASFSTFPTTTFRDTAEMAGGNILARWTHTYSDTSNMTAQLYYDRTERDAAELEQYHDTIDFEFFHKFSFGERQKLTWGIGYRFIGDDIDNVNGSTSTFDTEIRSSHIFSTFVQNEITLVPERLTLTLGTKLEQNSYTGFEHQPSGRLAWTPHKNHTVWAAVSRAVRTPSRFENDGTISITPSAAVSNTLSGDRDFDSENLLAYEIGYRVLPIENLSFDIAAFYNVYEELETNETRSTVPGFPVVNSIFIDNEMDGETYGVEAFANYQVTDWWRVSAGYSYLQIQVDKNSSSNDSGAEDEEGDSPHHQFQARSHINLPYGLEFDTAAYYVDNLPLKYVSSYIRLDTRVGWHVNDNLEVSVGLQNLLDPEHEEFHADTGSEATEIERSIFGQITWRH
jgi:iron complex outermembrane recepter protein